ncbi:MAG: ABC transporter substrate-binding protein [Cryomorphaceae bacterium]|nr:ABC transporter substrate-binding protein [Cryomorphaceae bacterium]
MYFIDPLGQEQQLQSPPKRIVSLVPSQTELLFDLGLDKEVVGITKFCIHPNLKWKEVARVGGTKNVRLDNVRRLQPDLIIANKEENTKDQIEALAAEFPVWMSNIHTLDEAFDMIRVVGNFADKQEEAENLVSEIMRNWAPIKNIAAGKKVAYLIWQHPEMLAANDTFIGDVLRFCGYGNVADNQTRYPEVSIERLQSLNPDHILLASEPFPFVEKHAARYRALFPNTSVKLVDGEMFSWYGSRMKLAAPYIASLF